jgi:hypothetical protein
MRVVLLIPLLLTALACYDPSESDVQQGFYLAAQKGDEAAVARMIRVDPSLATNPWKMPIDRGFKDRFPLVGAAREGRTQVVRLLLDKGASIEARDSSATALIMGAYGSHPEVVRLLLERGALVSARDEIGLSALDHAVMRNDAVSVVLLCAHGGGPGQAYDYSKTLSRFVAEGGECGPLRQAWSDRSAAQRDALVAEQVCRLDAHACRALTNAPS